MPPVKRNSGRQSSTSVNRWPCFSASARANCTRSCIGIGGRVTRAGRSPSQPRSSRREVSRNFACVSCAAREEIGQLALLRRAPRRRRPRRETRHRLDVVPNPQHGDLLQDLQRQVLCAARRRAPASGCRFVRAPLKDSPDHVEHARRGAVLLERGEQHRPLRRRRSARTSGQTRRRSSSCRCRRRRAAGRCAACRRRGRAPAAFRRGPKKPTSGGGGTPSRDTRACASNVDPQGRFAIIVALGTREQAQSARPRTRSARTSPAARCGSKAISRCGLVGQLLAAERHRLAQRLALHERGVQVGHEALAVSTYTT